MFFRYLKEGSSNDINITVRIYYCSDLTTYIREMNILNSSENINEMKYILKPKQYKTQRIERIEREKYKKYKVIIIILIYE